MNHLVDFDASGSPVLPALNRMSAGQYLQSASGEYQLLLQEDSNLVLRHNGNVIWIANDSQRYSRYYEIKHFERTFVIMREYLEVHQPAQKRYWCSVGYSAHGNNHDAGQRRVFAVLQDDGSLVLIDKVPLWSVNKSLWDFSAAGVGIRFDSGHVLEVGKEHVTEGARLVFQPDGALVSFAPSGARLWSSGTQGQGANLAFMQPDGNFVISANGRILWQSNTGGQSRRLRAAPTQWKFLYRY